MKREGDEEVGLEGWGEGVVVLKNGNKVVGLDK